MGDIGVLIDSDNLLVDEWNEIALYKISKLYSLELPPPDIHIYLAGTIGKFQNLDSNIISSNIFGSSDELDELVEMWDGNPNYMGMIYSISRSTGDYHLNLNAEVTIGRDIPFLAKCYQIAEIYSIKVGRPTEPQIFHTLSQEPIKYVDLLAAYYRHPDLEITKDDFRNFTKDVRQLGNIDLLICQIELVKPSKKDVKLINKEKKSN